MRPPKDAEYAWVRWHPHNVPTSIRIEIARYTKTENGGWWDICGSDCGYDDAGYKIEVLAYIPEFSAPDPGYPESKL